MNFKRKNNKRFGKKKARQQLFGNGTWSKHRHKRDLLAEKIGKMTNSERVDFCINLGKK